MTDAAPRDYSWSVPNRRFIDGGLYLPSMRTEGMGTLAVIIDTSGSVDTDVLAAFWSEVREVAAEIEPGRVVVLQVDAAVQDEQDYAPGELPERIVVKGRWGTDFRPGFARLAERGEQGRRAVSISRTWTATATPRPSPRSPVACGSTGRRGTPPGRNRRPGASTSGSGIDLRQSGRPSATHPTPTPGARS